MAITGTGSTGTAGSALGTTGGTSMAGLADWAAPYITGYLGQAQALGNAPYQTYQGPLTAGASGLQTQAFQGIGGLTVPNQGQYTPVGSTFDTKQAETYMNPYLKQALDPQLAELQRQSDIARLDDAARLTRAGAFGGSRQAIMESEARRNLLDKQAKVRTELGLLNLALLVCIELLHRLVVGGGVTLTQNVGLLVQQVAASFGLHDGLTATTKRTSTG